MQVTTHQTRPTNQTWQNPLNPRTLQSPKAAETEAKVHKWDLIKFISFCTAKETINKTKHSLHNGKKTFTNDATDKGLISKIYRQLTQLNIKKITQSKHGQSLNRNFCKENTCCVLCSLTQLGPTRFEKIHAGQCSSQHYLQQLRQRSNPDVHQQINE